MSFRIVLPPITSEFLNIFKNSAVASTIGLMELAAQGRQLVDYTAHSYESFIAVTALYAATSLCVLAGMRVVENLSPVPGRTSESRPRGKGGGRPIRARCGS